MGKDELSFMNPFLRIPPSQVPSFPIQSGFKSKLMERSSHHQRCSSENFLVEEQPSWLNDLLDDSEPVGPKHHRRSASETHLDNTLDCVLIGSPCNFQTNDVDNHVGPSHVSLKRNPKSFGGIPNKALDSTLIHHLGSSSQNQESFSEKNNVVQPKTCADAKRTKNNRQSTQRSRVRKLQYISELERNVHALQSKGSGFVAELEFRDQHNLILSIENQTLRQRIDTLSHELLLKNLEHEMLERELGRMQALLQLQMDQHQNQRKRS